MKFIAILIIVSILLNQYAPETDAASAASSNASVNNEVGSSLIYSYQHRRLAPRAAATSVTNHTEYLIRSYRGKRGVTRVVIDPDGTSYHCYKVKVKDGDQSKVNRGCMAVPADKGACEVLQDRFGESAVEECRACSSDKCNHGVLLQVSYFILAISILLRFLCS